jgi:hypothetical protein
MVASIRRQRTRLSVVFFVLALGLIFSASALAVGPSSRTGTESQLGLQRQFGFQAQTLDDAAQVHVNVGNGNVIFSQHVLTLQTD